MRMGWRVYMMRGKKTNKRRHDAMNEARCTWKVHAERSDGARGKERHVDGGRMAAHDRGRPGAYSVGGDGEITGARADDGRRVPKV
jgi:hypothetical protein